MVRVPKKRVSRGAFEGSLFAQRVCVWQLGGMKNKRILFGRFHIDFPQLVNPSLMFSTFSFSGSSWHL